MQEKKKILIIDDEPQYVAMLTARLQAHNYDVAAACDGKEGITLAQRIQPDLIILDMLMPQMFGDQVAKILKEHNTTKTIPILFLSAVPTEFLSGEEKAKGDIGQQADGAIFLSKLCSSEQLLETIATLLTAKQ